MTPQPSLDALGSIVKRYREQDLQVSQADLAWLAEVSRGTISNLETGRVTPDERTWYRIRTALALPRISPDEVQSGAMLVPVISVEALQGIIAAILAIRSRNPEVGYTVAGRWRSLVGKLTQDNDRLSPETDSELTWLARDVALMAPPQRLSAIRSAIQGWGWASEHQIPTEGSAPPRSSDGLDQVQQLFDTLASSVNDMAAQLRVLRGESQGFERLPVGIKNLLINGLVVDYDINHLEKVPAVSIIGLVIVNEDESSQALQRDAREASRRWSTVLRVAKYIYENLAPDRDPQEILDAVEYGLRTLDSNEVGQLRLQANGGEPMAMFKLGRLLKKSGRTDEAEQWFRRAADYDHPGALFNLGRLFHESGQLDKAEAWFRRAAEAGHPDAMLSLWELVRASGRTEEAERWLRCAADTGHPNALFKFALLVQESGRTEEAQHWLRLAADAGNRDALFRLGKMVQESGQTDEAERWLRRAAAAGHSGALNTFEIMLYEKRRAESISRKSRPPVTD
jgi:TPR repeat protein/DNA-binding XRE family transcriptional regulator